KTPRRSAKTPSRGNMSGSLRWETASTTAVRANCRAARWSASERDGILGLLAGFEHAEPAALLDAVVDVAPKAPEVLRGGDQRADDNEPEQNSRQGLERRVARSDDEHRHGAHLQNHLRLAKGGSFDCESLRRRDIAQAENCEFPADDDDHHPCRNKVHVHKRNERGGDQELVGNGVEKNAECRHLKASPS